MFSYNHLPLTSSSISPNLISAKHFRIKRACSLLGISSWFFIWPTKNQHCLAFLYFSVGLALFLKGVRLKNIGNLPWQVQFQSQSILPALFDCIYLQCIQSLNYQQKRIVSLGKFRRLLSLIWKLVGFLAMTISLISLGVRILKVSFSAQ